MKTHIIAIASAALIIGIGGAAFARPQSEATADESTAGHRTDGARGLDALIEEAMAHSPLIEAARRHWEAQTKAPIQAATLPDPQITFQNFSVGDPGPGSGLGNSDFAYLGFGASQDLPFPGKLGLQAAMAQKDAAYARQQYEAARREITEKVRELYFELSYHAKTASLVHRIRGELEPHRANRRGALPRRRGPSAGRDQGAAPADRDAQGAGDARSGSRPGSGQAQGGARARGQNTRRRAGRACAEHDSSECG